MYTIKDMAKLAGVSTRTLRYYDEIGLLNAKKNESNYRIYDEDAIDRLQQICLYKSYGFTLLEIKSILNDHGILIDKLSDHLKYMKKEKVRISKIISTIEKSILHQKGEIEMKQNEKFIGIKEKMIEKNEKKYGKELNRLYDKEVENSYEMIRKMDKQSFKNAKDLEKDILEQLKIAFDTQNVSSNEAIKLCRMHEKWIKMYWKTYDKEKHLNLVKMYLDDKRFTAYYDKVFKGATKFLYHAMLNYLNI